MRLFYTLLAMLLLQSVDAQVNLNLGLRAYYPFTGNANDVSGNGNNGVVNSAVLTADRLGNPNSAYHFNGSSSIQVANSSSLQLGGQISMSAWVKVTAFNTSPCSGNAIMMKGNTEFVPSTFFMRYSPVLTGCSASPDYTTEQFYAGSNGTGPLVPDFIQLNRWYSVVATYDGTNFNFYVDCILKKSIVAPGLNFNNPDPLLIGRTNLVSYPYFLNGDIDEVRIYNRALNQDEINVLGGCALTGPNLSNIINEYTPVTGFDICKNSLVLEDASMFNTGDTVLLIQMKGAGIDSTNTSTFGTISDYKNAGNYEYNYVKSKSGNTIQLKNLVTRQYTIPDGKVQLIRVPYYQSANITATLTCLPWDGSKGGVLVFNVRDTLNLLGDIDVSGKGFRGGVMHNSMLNVSNCGINEYFYPINTIFAAGKGESIADLSDAKNAGKGKKASGGGGGMDTNSGGGGGSNGGTGGRGGFQYGTCPNPTIDNWGIGGTPLSYTPAANQTFIGGGGGAGHCNNGFENPAVNTDFNGGAGGGLVLISSNYIAGNNKNIISNGDVAYELTAPGFLAHDGMGGGGGGGTVMLNNNTYLSNVNIKVLGGRGGNMSASLVGGLVGPGGGGSGGIVWVKQNSIPANVIVTNTGGANGILLGNGSPYGATSGTAGSNSFNLSVPVDVIPFKINIDSVRFNFTNTLCNHFDFSGLAYTNTSPIASWQWYFGDAGTANTQNTSHNYASNGPFDVKLVVTDINGCKDSITKTVNIFPVTADAGLPQSGCGNPSAVFNLHVSAAGTGLTYTWTPAAGLNDIHSQNPVATISSTSTYTVNVTNATGCSSNSSVTLTVGAVVTGSSIVSICEGVTYQGHTTSGTYINTYIAVNGCDSVHTLNLMVKPKSFSTINAAICDGTTYAGHTTAGTYTDTYTAANGCDSIRKLNLTIKPRSFTTNTQSICQGASYEGHTTSGTYVSTLVAANGCDSIYTLNLTVKPKSFTTNNQSICEGASYEGHTTSGTYVSTLVAANGCDSVYTLNLTVKPKSFTTSNQTICEGASYEGHTTSGTYVSTLVAANGCDSIYTLNLTVKPRSFSTVNAAICEGQSYNGHTTAGTYTDTYTAANGCDSIRTLNLTVKPRSFTTNNQSICEGTSYEGHTTSGTYVNTLVAANGCDSVYTLNLIVKPKSFTTNNQSICEGSAYEGHTTSGTYISTLVAANGCDSVYTLNLIVKPKSFSTINAAVCQGQTYEGYSTAGTFMDTFIAANGCDSIRTLNLTIKPKSFSTVTTAICEGQAYDGHTTAGTYIDTYTAANGCDSIRTLNLTIKPKSFTNNIQSICEGQVYQGHSTTGTYVTNLTAANGCDSVYTLILTVKPKSFTNDIQSICEGQSYEGHTTGGTYVSTFTAANGCDSVHTLTLTVNSKSFSNDNRSICEGESYQGHSTAGTYISTFLNAAGCDSTYTLNLSLKPNPVIKASKSNDLDCSNLSAKLNVTGGVSYNWSPAATLNSSTGPNPVASPVQTTEYYVEGTGINGCIGYDTIKVIKTGTGQGTIYIPNSFSPNGDSKNDCFKIIFFGSVQEFHLMIYDRWGEKVFETNNPDNCWNGTYKGKPALEAAYVYYISAKTSCGNFTQKGNLLLLR